MIALVALLRVCGRFRTVKASANTPAGAQAPRVIRFGCHDTRKNFPKHSSRKRGESNFLRGFEKAYLAEILPTSVPFAHGREFSLIGYGRADLIWLAWRNRSGASQDFSAVAVRRAVRVTAIEAKLRDWRKGLAQAAKYRYFAHRSVLVLAPETIGVALPHLATFRRLGVCLWEFDAKTGKIKKYITPQEATPLNARAYARALNMIEHRLKLS